MTDLYIAAAGFATPSAVGVNAARFGTRFGRLDQASQLALLAVEQLGLDFGALPRERIGICLSARAGSLSTDLEFWRGRDAVGGPSPTLFAYTLPSAAIGEIAIRHKLTGPNLCFTGSDRLLLTEAADWIRRGEAEACVCVGVRSVSDAAAALILERPEARAAAIFLSRVGPGLVLPSGENDRDMEPLCARFCALKSGP